MNVEIANRLQMLRKKNGYSQEELAEKIGISRQAVSKWERAEASPDTDNLILLAKLYGVTIDELLRTDSSVTASDGISLRKEDYEYKSVPEDDGEIYPNRRETSRSAETASGGDVHGYYDAGRKSGEENTSSDNPDAGEFIRSTADFAVNVAKEAIGTAAKAISEADKRIKSGESAEKSVETSFEQNFEGFGERVEEFGERFAQRMEGIGKRAERRFEHIEKHAERRVEKAERIHACYEEKRSAAERKKAENREKYRATLLDKLFPLIIVCFFFFTVSMGFAHPGWMIFFLIPIYYIYSSSLKRLKAGKLTFFQALIRFIDGALPVGLTFIFFFLGFLTEWWNLLWTIYFILPLYYTAKAAIKRRNLMIFCYPAAAAWAFFGVGIIFREWMFGLIFLATIPFYYIIVDHYRKKDS